MLKTRDFSFPNIREILTLKQIKKTPSDRWNGPFYRSLDTLFSPTGEATTSRALSVVINVDNTTMTPDIALACDSH